MTDDARIEPPGTGDEWTLLTTMLDGIVRPCT